MKRHKTDYPGVFYRESERIGGRGLEKVFYIVFKRDGRVYEEKVGRQYKDDMTPARASRIRGERIEGKRQSRKEIREQAQATIWTVARLWDEYLLHTPLKGEAQDRSRFEKYIRPTWGDKEPHDIQLLDVDRARLRSLKGKSPQTVKNVLALLRRIINFGVKRNLCQPLAFHLDMPKTNNVKTEDLIPEQLSRLLAAIEEDPHQDAANMMKLALFTGMRRGEMFRLQWKDIDFERSFIHIRNPKGGQDQQIPLNESARGVLTSICHTKGDIYVFPGRGGCQRTDIKKQVNRIKKRAGLPADFRALHGLRHVYASMLASSGEVDLYTLQKLLTHKSPQMTQRYAHLRDEALRRASDLAGDLIAQSTKQPVTAVVSGK